MKLVSFNINGIRANNKNTKNNALQTIIDNYDPEIISLQEIKCSDCHIDEFLIYKNYPNIMINPSRARKGYSGVGILSKIKPINVFLDFDFLKKDFDYSFVKEGRLITAEFDNFYVISCYSPNSKDFLKRLDERVNFWEPLLREYINTLQQFKPVILCGDLNVAHNNIDIFNPKTHVNSACFTIQEREAFSKLLNDCKMIDTFRELYPNEVKYTFWSYLARGRIKNNGWRLDYFVISKKLKKKMKNALILDHIYGSDHCPILLELF
jgi:exodeoxyribonuclease-3